MHNKSHDAALVLGITVIVHIMKQRYFLLLVAMALTTVAVAQDDEEACPGFRNTTTFAGGNNNYFWSARVGARVYPSGSNDTTTGYYVMSTCVDPNCPAIYGNNILSSTYNTGSDAGITCCSHGNLWDAAQDHRFMIITSANAGLDELTVNAAGQGMQRIPPGYQTSIRLGDPRASYSSGVENSHTWSSNNTKGSEALFYTMRVTPDNALLFINYAVVGRCYSHTAREAGEFLIRVVKQNADGSWPNAPINDNMWFKVSAPAIPTSGPIPPWVSGRPGSSCASTTCAYVYKPWTKVAISLSEYLYSNVRVEMYTSDCIYDVDPIYAYIAGDYQPMRLLSSGCPDPASSVVDTLRAPSDMISYRWYVATHGAELNIYDAPHMDSVEFRPVGNGDTTRYIYTPTLADFVLSAGPNAGDTVAEQTFMCIMTSALDPMKPFASKLYANVTNRRPLIRYRYEAHCDTTVTFHNGTTVLVSDGLNFDSTRWIIYSDTACTMPIDTVWGEVATAKLPHPGSYGVKLYCVTAGDPCATSQTFTVRALSYPKADFTMEKHVMCDGETMQIPCTEGCQWSKYWTVDTTRYEPTATDSLNVFQYTAAIGVHTIGMTVTDADGCVSSKHDTVTVYGIPVLELDSRYNAICEGDSVTITATGNTTYTWVSAPPDPDLDRYQGMSTITVSPATTTTYYLRANEENPCSNEGASVMVDVIPYPVPAMRISPAYVSFEKNRVTLEDISSYRAATYWTFSDGMTAEGMRVTHTYGNLDADSVGFTMRSCNELECCSDTTVWIPVQTFSVWFPNIFTPDEETNNRFNIITSLPLDEYEIFIYNRTGQMVYTSTDPLAQWDGRDMEGRPLPQGAYVYFYRYIRYDGGGYKTGKGTVTMIR